MPAAATPLPAGRPLVFWTSLVLPGASPQLAPATPASPTMSEGVHSPGLTLCHTAYNTSG